MPRISASNQTEQIQRILSPKSLYHDNDIDDLMNKITSYHPDIHYISPVIAQIPGQFQESLQGFMKDVNKQRLAIIFCKNGHFTTIFANKPDGNNLSDPWEVLYLDPAIDFSPLDEDLRSIMREEMSGCSTNTNPFLQNAKRGVSLLATRAPLQSLSYEPIFGTSSVDNNHCGPFVIAFLDGVINGEIKHFNHASEEKDPFHLECNGVEISGLSKVYSNECGKKLRERQAEILQGRSNEQQNSQANILKEFLEKERSRGRAENSASSNPRGPKRSIGGAIFSKLSGIVRGKKEGR